MTSLRVKTLDDALVGAGPLGHNPQIFNWFVENMVPSLREITRLRRELKKIGPSSPDAPFMKASITAAEGVIEANLARLVGDGRMKIIKDYLRRGYDMWLQMFGAFRQRDALYCSIYSDDQALYTGIDPHDPLALPVDVGIMKTMCNIVLEDSRATFKQNMTSLQRLLDTETVYILRGHGAETRVAKRMVLPERMLLSTGTVFGLTQFSNDIDWRRIPDRVTALNTLRFLTSQLNTHHRTLHTYLPRDRYPSQMCFLFMYFSKSDRIGSSGIVPLAYTKLHPFGAAMKLHAEDDDTEDMADDKRLAAYQEIERLEIYEDEDTIEMPQSHEARVMILSRALQYLVNSGTPSRFEVIRDFVVVWHSQLGLLRKKDPHLTYSSVPAPQDELYKKFMQVMQGYTGDPGTKVHLHDLIRNASGQVEDVYIHMHICRVDMEVYSLTPHTPATVLAAYLASVHVQDVPSEEDDVVPIPAASDDDVAAVTRMIRLNSIRTQGPLFATLLGPKLSTSLPTGAVMRDLGVPELVEALNTYRGHASAGDIAAVLATLREHAENVGVAAAACGLLALQSNNYASESSAVMTDILHVLLRVLTLHGKEVSVVLPACQAIANLADYVEFFDSAVMCMQLMAKALQQHGKHTDVAVAACTALQLVSACTNFAQCALIAPECTAALVYALINQQNTVGVAVPACAALGNFFLAAKTTEVTAYRCIKWITATLVHHFTDADVARNACHALQVIFMGNVPSQTEINDCINKMAYALEIHMKNVDVVISVCDALHQAIVSDESRCLATTHIDLMVRTLRDHMRTTSVADSLCEALVWISARVDQAVLLERAGGIVVLVDTLQWYVDKNIDAVACAACQVLTQIFDVERILAEVRTQSKTWHGLQVAVQSMIRQFTGTKVAYVAVELEKRLLP